MKHECTHALKVKTMTIKVDFSKMSSIEDYNSEVSARLKDKDVAVLIINGNQ